MDVYRAVAEGLQRGAPGRWFSRVPSDCTTLNLRQDRRSPTWS